MSVGFVPSSKLRDMDGIEMCFCVIWNFIQMAFFIFQKNIWKKEE